MRPFRIAALVMALWMLASVPAFAGERETVVLVAPTGDAFETRMRAELESMGFDVVVQGQLQGDPKGVLAVARIVAGPPRRIEVVVVSTDESLRVPSRTAIIDAPAADDETVVSVRAAEQLRAFFQPLRPPTPPPPPPEKPTPSPSVRLDALPPPPASPPPLQVVADAARPQKAKHETWLLTLGAGPAFDVGGVGVDLALSGRLRLGSFIAVGAFVVAPLTATTVEGTGGTADVRTGALGADLALTLELAGGDVLVMPSIGFGGAVLATTGNASSPYTNDSDAAVSAMPFARLEIAPRIAGPVRISAQGMIGMALPSVAVRFAEKEVATWGAPWGAALIGVGVGW